MSFSILPRLDMRFPSTHHWVVANLAVLPAAGTLALFVQPGRGLWASVAKKWTPDKHWATISARRIEGGQALKASTPEECQRLLVAFDIAKRTLQERKKGLHTAAMDAMTLPEISGGGKELERYAAQLEVERQKLRPDRVHDTVGSSRAVSPATEALSSLPSSPPSLSRKLSEEPLIVAPVQLTLSPSQLAQDLPSSTSSPATHAETLETDTELGETSDSLPSTSSSTEYLSCNDDPTVTLSRRATDTQEQFQHASSGALPPS